MEYHDCELSIVIVDDPEIAELNRQYRGKAEPTNVLSFPMLEGDFNDVNPAGLLGDVVISADTVAREAVEYGYTTEEMFDFYLIHGILHLVGYDHTGSEEETLRMESRTQELFEVLGH